MRKGDTVGAFLGKARAQLAPDFREMRVASVENMLYVKEDLILPHHLSFYDLIINKARGKVRACRDRTHSQTHIHTYIAFLCAPSAMRVRSTCVRLRRHRMLITVHIPS